MLFRSVVAAGLEWDRASAHSARYDAEQTADLFCDACNQFKPIYDQARKRVARALETGELKEQAGDGLMEPSPEPDDA